MGRTKSVSIWFIAVLVALVFVVKCVNATVYYMDNGVVANDSTGGTWGMNVSKPWATLGYAEDVMVAGDTPFIRPVRD